MYVWQSQSKYIKSILQEQEVRYDLQYRKIDFCFLNNVDGDNVAYNSLTGEIISLTEEEYAFLTGVATPCEQSEELIKKWFLVPLDHNDIGLVEELRAFCKIFPAPKGPKVTSYTIFPTLDCNARCFYCFELGCSRKSMDEKTAKETAEFILRTRGSEQVRLIWFGGEPLYNSAAIDTICSILDKEEVPFSSHMVSNAYLFDDETAKKAIELWKLRRVQITLDGTEDIYNKTKAYIYKNGANPFVVVTDNIERLAKAGLSVIIRINMTQKNCDDLYKLVDFVSDRYKQYSNVRMYPHLLFETEESYAKAGSQERRLDEVEQLLALEQYCIDKNVAYIAPVTSKIRTNSCMADAEDGYMISPEGQLGTCEHYTDSEFVGNVIDGVVDRAKQESFCEYWNGEDLCKGCRLYPTCLRLRKCPTKFYKCDEANRKLLEMQMERRFAYTYRMLKENQKNKAE